MEYPGPHSTSVENIFFNWFSFFFFFFSGKRWQNVFHTDHYFLFFAQTVKASSSSSVPQQKCWCEKWIYVVHLRGGCYVKNGGQIIKRWDRWPFFFLSFFHSIFFSLPDGRNYNEKFSLRDVEKQFFISKLRKRKKDKTKVFCKMICSLHVADDIWIGEN